MRVILFAALILCASLVASADQSAPASIEAAKLQSVAPAEAEPHVPYALTDESNRDLHRFTSEMRLRQIRSDAEYDRKIEDLHKSMAAERKEVNDFIHHASKVSKSLNPVLAEETETESQPVPVHHAPKQQVEKQAVKQIEKEEKEMRFRAAPTPIQASFKETRSSGDGDVETESISAIRDALASFKRELKSGQLPPDDIAGVEQQVATLRQELAEAERRRERSTHIPTVRSKGRPGLHITSLLSKLSSLQAIEASSPLGLRSLSLSQLRSLEHSLRALLPVLRAYHHRDILYKKMQHRAEIERLNRMEDEIRKRKEMVLRQSQLDVASQNAYTTYQPVSTTSYMYSPCYQQAAQSCSPQTYACSQTCSGVITCRASCQQAHLTCVRHYTSACPGPNQVVNFLTSTDPAIVPAGTLSGNPVAAGPATVQPEYARFAQVQSKTETKATTTAAATQQSQQQAAAAAKEAADLQLLMAEEQKQKQTLDRQTQILDRLSEMKNKHSDVEPQEESDKAVEQVTEKADKDANKLRFVQVSKRAHSRDVDVNEFDKFVDAIEHKPHHKHHKKHHNKNHGDDTASLRLHQSSRLSHLMAKMNHEYHHQHRYQQVHQKAKSKAKSKSKSKSRSSSQQKSKAETQSQSQSKAQNQNQAQQQTQTQAPAAGALPTVLTSQGFPTRGAPTSPVAKYTLTPEYLDTPTLSLNVQAPANDNAEVSGFKPARAISPGVVVPTTPIQYTTPQPNFNSHPTIRYQTTPVAASAPAPASTAASASTTVMRLMEQAYNGNVEVDA